jgi:UDP:flavonoid glycosyltransferase YjiC (YdhE family)
MARIALATFGSLGDLHPFLAVAEALRARGHDPVVITHGGHRPRIERAGIRFAPLRPDLTDFGDLAEVMRKAMDGMRGSDYVIRTMTVPWIRRTTEDVLAAAEGADALVSSSLVLGAGAVAERLGIPWFPAALQPGVLLSPWDPPRMSVFGWPIVRATRPASVRVLLALTRLSLAPVMGQLGRLRSDWGLPPDRSFPLFDPPRNAARFLALYSEHFAPIPRDRRAHTTATGFPFHDEGGDDDLSPELRAFLAAGEPPVTFTLGSSAVWSAGDFHHLAAEAASTLGVRAVLMVGEDLGQVPEDLPASVIAVPYAPHRALFTRSRAIVHQGGIGTTAQALRSGRPSLVVPFSHDQPDNGARLSALGAGLVVPRARLRADTMRRSLARLLGEPSFAAAAAQVGERIRGEDGAGTAATIVSQGLHARGGLLYGPPPDGSPSQSAPVSAQPRKDPA